MGNNPSKQANTKSDSRKDSGKDTGKIAPEEKKLPVPVAPSSEALISSYFENRPKFKQQSRAFHESLSQGDQSIHGFIKKLLTRIPQKIVDQLNKEDQRASRLSNFAKSYPEQYKKLLTHGANLTNAKDSGNLLDNILDVFDTIKSKHNLQAESDVIYEWAHADAFPPHAFTPELPSSDQFSVFQLFNSFPVVYFALDLLITSDGTKYDSFDAYAKGSLPDPNYIIFETPNNFHTLAWDYNKDSPTDGNKPGPWYEDAQYGNQRFNGFSAAVIAVVQSTDTIPAADVQSISNELSTRFTVELKTAVENGALFVEDYTILGTCQDAGYTGSSQLKWQPVSVAYFYYDSSRRQLLPFWIKVSARNNAVSWSGTFTSTMGQWPWRWAKSCLQASAFQYHEAGAHLTLTHLVEEVFATAMRIVFADTDPLYNLLDCHFVRTFALNDKARTTLAPGALTVLSGTNLNGVLNMVGTIFSTFGQQEWDTHYLPNNLASRGFTQQVYSNLPYYYAQDGVRIYQNLHTFATAFVQKYYPSNEAVKSDSKLSSWVQQIRTHGMPKFPDFQGNSQVTPQEQLASVLCFIMFNASVQHSAVNYLQAYYMSYGAATPGYMSGPFPTADEKWSEQRVCNSLPGDKGAQLQIAIMALLSQPVKEIKDGPQPMVGAMEAAVDSSLPGLKDAFTTFQNNMQQISSSIATRNQQLTGAGQIPYFILDPVNNVANSIQI